MTKKDNVSFPFALLLRRLGRPSTDGPPTGFLNPCVRLIKTNCYANYRNTKPKILPGQSRKISIFILSSDFDSSKFPKTPGDLLRAATAPKSTSEACTFPKAVSFHTFSSDFLRPPNPVTIIIYTPDDNPLAATNPGKLLL